MNKLLSDSQVMGDTFRLEEVGSTAVICVLTICAANYLSLKCLAGIRREREREREKEDRGREPFVRRRGRAVLSEEKEER